MECTAIPNNIIDKWMNVLSFSELKIFLIMIRRLGLESGKSIKVSDLMRFTTFKGKNTVKDTIRILQDYDLITQMPCITPIKTIEEASFKINTKKI